MMTRGAFEPSASNALDHASDAAFLIRDRSEQRSSRLARAQLAIKRAIDIVGASFLLLVLAVPLTAIAIVIKMTSPGPILFRQPRYGRGSETFQILKFRTMFEDQGDHSGVTQTQSDDPRVTPFGRFLRRWNIDELPQLINVLRGDMSLVGPRPHVPGMRAAGVLYETLVPNYFARHRMQPGITGLAQISELRGSTADPRFAKARIDYDLAYIDDWSLRLDLAILWTTLKTECLRGTGI